MPLVSLRRGRYQGPWPVALDFVLMGALQPVAGGDHEYQVYARVKRGNGPWRMERWA